MSSDEPPRSGGAENGGGQENQSANSARPTPPAIPDDKPPSPKKKGGQVFSNILQTATLVFVASYTVLTYLLLSNSNDALNVSRNEFEMSQRPWVSAAATVIEPFTYRHEPNGTSISLLYTLTNVGHSPAQNVWINPLTFPEMTDVDAASKEACKDTPPPPGAKRILGFTLFPNETIQVQWGSDISKGTIDKLNSEYGREIKVWVPTIVTCVGYRSPTGEGIHHTPLILSLVMKRSKLKEGRGCCGIIIADSPIPAEDLEITRTIFDLPAD